MEPDDCQERAERLKGKIPLLAKIINNCKVKYRSTPAFEKIKSLHGILTANKKIKYDTMVKCEDVLERVLANCDRYIEKNEMIPVTTDQSLQCTVNKFEECRQKLNMLGYNESKAKAAININLLVDKSTNPLTNLSIKDTIDLTILPEEQESILGVTNIFTKGSTVVNKNVTKDVDHLNVNVNSLGNEINKSSNSLRTEPTQLTQVQTTSDLLKKNNISNESQITKTASTEAELGYFRANDRNKSQTSLLNTTVAEISKSKYKIPKLPNSVEPTLNVITIESFIKKNKPTDSLKSNESPQVISAAVSQPRKKNDHKRKHKHKHKHSKNDSEDGKAEKSVNFKKCQSKTNTVEIPDKSIDSNAVYESEIGKHKTKCDDNIQIQKSRDKIDKADKEKSVENTKEEKTGGKTGKEKTINPSKKQKVSDKNSERYKKCQNENATEISPNKSDKETKEISVKSKSSCKYDRKLKKEHRYKGDSGTNKTSPVENLRMAPNKKINKEKHLQKSNAEQIDHEAKVIGINSDEIKRDEQNEIRLSDKYAKKCPSVQGKSNENTELEISDVSGLFCTKRGLTMKEIERFGLQLTEIETQNTMECNQESHQFNDPRNTQPQPGRLVQDRPQVYRPSTNSSFSNSKISMKYLGDRIALHPDGQISRGERVRSNDTLRIRSSSPRCMSSPFQPNSPMYAPSTFNMFDSDDSYELKSLASNALYCNRKQLHRPMTVTSTSDMFNKHSTNHQSKTVPMSPTSMRYSVPTALHSPTKRLDTNVLMPAQAVPSLFAVQYPPTNDMIQQRQQLPRQSEISTNTFATYPNRRKSVCEADTVLTSPRPLYRQQEIFPQKSDINSSYNNSNSLFTRSRRSTVCLSRPDKPKYRGYDPKPAIKQKKNAPIPNVGVENLLDVKKNNEEGIEKIDETNSFTRQTAASAKVIKDLELKKPIADPRQRAVPRSKEDIISMILPPEKLPLKSQVLDSVPTDEEKLAGLELKNISEEKLIPSSSLFDGQKIITNEIVVNTSSPVAALADTSSEIDHSKHLIQVPEISESTNDSQISKPVTTSIDKCDTAEGLIDSLIDDEEKIKLLLEKLVSKGKIEALKSKLNDLSTSSENESKMDDRKVGDDNCDYRIVETNFEKKDISSDHEKHNKETEIKRDKSTEHNAIKEKEIDEKAIEEIATKENAIEKGIDNTVSVQKTKNEVIKENTSETLRNEGEELKVDSVIENKNKKKGHVTASTETKRPRTPRVTLSETTISEKNNLNEKEKANEQNITIKPAIRSSPRTKKNNLVQENKNKKTNLKPVDNSHATADLTKLHIFESSTDEKLKTITDLPNKSTKIKADIKSNFVDIESKNDKTSKITQSDIFEHLIDSIERVVQESRNEYKDRGNIDFEKDEEYSILPLKSGDDSKHSSENRNKKNHEENNINEPMTSPARVTRSKIAKLVLSKEISCESQINLHVQKPKCKENDKESNYLGYSVIETSDHPQMSNIDEIIEHATDGIEKLKNVKGKSKRNLKSNDKKNPCIVTAAKRRKSFQQSEEIVIKSLENEQLQKKSAEILLDSANVSIMKSNTKFKAKRGPKKVMENKSTMSGRATSTENALVAEIVDTSLNKTPDFEKSEIDKNKSTSERTEFLTIPDLPVKRKPRVNRELELLHEDIRDNFSAAAAASSGRRSCTLKNIAVVASTPSARMSRRMSVCTIATEPRTAIPPQFPKPETKIFAERRRKLILCEKIPLVVLDQIDMGTLQKLSRSSGKKWLFFRVRKNGEKIPKYEKPPTKIPLYLGRTRTLRNRNAKIADTALEIAQFKHIRLNEGCIDDVLKLKPNSRKRPGPKSAKTALKKSKTTEYDIKDYDKKAKIRKPNKLLNNISQLQSMYIGTSLKKYGCKHCSYSGQRIIHHYVNNHPDVEVLYARLSNLTAKICIKESNDYNYENVLEIKKSTQNQRGKFRCRFCSGVLENQTCEEFYAHLTMHTGEFQITCKECSLKVPDMETMQRHFHARHPTKQCESNSIKDNTETNKNIFIVFGYMCSVCNYVQLKPGRLDEHVKSHDKAKVHKINLSSIKPQFINDCLLKSEELKKKKTEIFKREQELIFNNTPSQNNVFTYNEISDIDKQLEDERLNKMNEINESLQQQETNRKQSRIGLIDLLKTRFETIESQNTDNNTDHKTIEDFGTELHLEEDLTHNDEFTGIIDDVLNLENEMCTPKIESIEGILESNDSDGEKSDKITQFFSTIVGPVSAMNEHGKNLKYKCSNVCNFSTYSREYFLLHLEKEHASEFWDGECSECMHKVPIPEQGQVTIIDALKHLMVHVNQKIIKQSPQSTPEVTPIKSASHTPTRSTLNKADCIRAIAQEFEQVEKELHTAMITPSKMDGLINDQPRIKVKSISLLTLPNLQASNHDLISKTNSLNVDETTDLYSDFTFPSPILKEELVNTSPPLLRVQLNNRIRSLRPQLASITALPMEKKTDNPRTIPQMTDISEELPQVMPKDITQVLPDTIPQANKIVMSQEIQTVGIIEPKNVTASEIAQLPIVKKVADLTDWVINKSSFSSIETDAISGTEDYVITDVFSIEQSNEWEHSVKPYLSNDSMFTITESPSEGSELSTNVLSIDNIQTGKLRTTPLPLSASTDKSCSYRNISHWKTLVTQLHPKDINYRGYLANKYKCPFENCRFATSRYVIFGEHLDTDHLPCPSSTITCPYCFGIQNRSLYADHLASHSEVFQCSDCLFRSHTRVQMYEHLTVDHHDGSVNDILYLVKPYTESQSNVPITTNVNCFAESCNLQFQSWTAIYTHMAVKHPKIQTAKCKICGQLSDKILQDNDIFKNHLTNSDILHAMSWHYQFHTMGLFNCVYCNFSEFNNRVKFDCHFLIKHKRCKPALFKLDTSYKTEQEMPYIAFTLEIVEKIEVDILELKEMQKSARAKKTGTVPKKIPVYAYRKQVGIDMIDVNLSDGSNDNRQPKEKQSNSISNQHVEAESAQQSSNLRNKNINAETPLTKEIDSTNSFLDPQNFYCNEVFQTSSSQAFENDISDTELLASIESIQNDVKEENQKILENSPKADEEREENIKEVDDIIESNDNHDELIIKHGNKYQTKIETILIKETEEQPFVAPLKQPDEVSTIKADLSAFLNFSDGCKRKEAGKTISENLTKNSAKEQKTIDNQHKKINNKNTTENESTNKSVGIEHQIDEHANPDKINLVTELTEIKKLAHVEPSKNPKDEIDSLKIIVKTVDTNVPDSEEECLKTTRISTKECGDDENRIVSNYENVCDLTDTTTIEVTPLKIVQRSAELCDSNDQLSNHVDILPKTPNSSTTTHCLKQNQDISLSLRSTIDNSSFIRSLDFIADTSIPVITCDNERNEYRKHQTSRDNQNEQNKHSNSNDSNGDQINGEGETGDKSSGSSGDDGDGRQNNTNNDGINATTPIKSNENEESKDSNEDPLSPSRDLPLLVVDEEETEANNPLTQSCLIGEKLYRCGNLIESRIFCQFAAVTANGLREHYKTCEFLTSDSATMCYHCKKRMRNVQAYVEHLKSHGFMRFRCSMCTFASSRLAWVNKHLRAKHHVTQTNTVGWQDISDGDCANADESVIFVRPTTCGSNIKVREQKAQVEVDNSALYYNVPLKKKVYLPEEIHLLPRAPVYSYYVQCELCQFKTRTRTNMVRHLEAHKTGEQPRTGEKINFSPALERKEKMFDKMSNLAFGSIMADQEKNRVADMKKPTSDMVEQSSTPLEYDNVTENVEGLPRFIPKAERFTCGLVGCNHKTCDENMLRYHYRILHGDETCYSCPHCSESTTVDKLGIHLKMHDSRLFKCTYCVYNHYQRKFVEKHVTEKHAEKAPFVLKIREFTETDRAATTTTHHGDEEGFRIEKKWRCGFCKYRGIFQKEVIDHAATQHAITYQFKCLLCPYQLKNTHNDENFNGDIVFSTHYRNIHPTCHTIDYIRSYYEEVSEDAPNNAPEPIDTTPLWKRNHHRIRHIRGILIDEPVLNTVTQKNVAGSTSGDSKLPTPVKSSAGKILRKALTTKDKVKSPQKMKPPKSANVIRRVKTMDDVKANFQSEITTSVIGHIYTKPNAFSKNITDKKNAMSSSKQQTTKVPPIPPIKIGELRKRAFSICGSGLQQKTVDVQMEYDAKRARRKSAIAHELTYNKKLPSGKSFTKTVQRLSSICDELTTASRSLMESQGLHNFKRTRCNTIGDISLLSIAKNGEGMGNENELYYCRVCCMVLSSEIDYVEHRCSHAFYARYRCITCNLCSYFHKPMLKHITRCKDSVIKAVLPPEKRSFIRSIIDAVNKYRQKLAGARFVAAESLEELFALSDEKIFEEMKIEGIVDSTTVLSDFYVRDTKKLGAVTFTDWAPTLNKDQSCPICKYASPYGKSDVINHYFDHWDRPMYQCGVCGNSNSSTISQMNLHFKQCHYSIPPKIILLCDISDIRTTNKVSSDDKNEIISCTTDDNSNSSDELINNSIDDPLNISDVNRILANNPNYDDVDEIDNFEIVDIDVLKTSSTASSIVNDGKPNCHSSEPERTLRKRKTMYESPYVEKSIEGIDWPKKKKVKRNRTVRIPDSVFESIATKIKKIDNFQESLMETNVKNIRKTNIEPEILNVELLGDGTESFGDGVSDDLEIISDKGQCEFSEMFYQEIEKLVCAYCTTYLSHSILLYLHWSVFHEKKGLPFKYKKYLNNNPLDAIPSTSKASIVESVAMEQVLIPCPEPYCKKLCYDVSMHYCREHDAILKAFGSLKQRFFYIWAVSARKVPLNMSENIPPLLTLYRCGLCEISVKQCLFESRMWLNEHVCTVHKEYTTEHCTGIPMKIKYFSCHLCSLQQRTYTSSSCNVMFNHMKRHIQAFPVTCNTCRQLFMTESSLNAHAHSSHHTIKWDNLADEKEKQWEKFQKSVKVVVTNGSMYDFKDIVFDKPTVSLIPSNSVADIDDDHNNDKTDCGNNKIEFGGSQQTAQSQHILVQTGADKDKNVGFSYEKSSNFSERLHGLQGSDQHHFEPLALTRVNSMVVDDDVEFISVDDD